MQTGIGLYVVFPLSILLRSSTSLIREGKCSELLLIFSRKFWISGDGLFCPFAFLVKRHRITVQYIHIKLFSQNASSGFIYNLRHNKNISIISKENAGDISPCLFLQSPIGYIVNYDSFIAILGMFDSSNNHIRISISNLKPRKAFSLKCFLPGNVVADLNIKLLAASLSNKVDFILIELADINII